MSEQPLSKTSRLRIGELAARTGRSVHAIRWYEAQGLIPGVMRDPGGRRVYNGRHVGWLELIDRLRRTGMSVAQLREYAALATQGKTSLPAQREMLRAHRTYVEGTIEEWQRALVMVDRKIAFFDEWLATGTRPVDEAPARLAATRAPARRTRLDARRRSRAMASP